MFYMYKTISKVANRCEVQDTHKKINSIQKMWMSGEFIFSCTVTNTYIVINSHDLITTTKHQIRFVNTNIYIFILDVTLPRVLPKKWVNRSCNARQQIIYQKSRNLEKYQKSWKITIFWKSEKYREKKNIYLKISNILKIWNISNKMKNKLKKYINNFN